jgi:Ca2+-transporting ATPase
MISTDTLYFLLSIGLSAAIALILLYTYSLGISDVKGYTMLFTGFVVLELFTVYIVRGRYGSGLLSNNWLHLAVLISLALQLAILYTPLSDLFLVEPLALGDWGIIGIAQLGYLFMVWALLQLEPAMLRLVHTHK